jgi:crossover junction endodeoxyribonuclease RuvC
MSCILGVDPGISGAIAFYFPGYPDRVAVEDTPVVDGEVDVATLTSRILQMSPNVAIVERVSARLGIAHWPSDTGAVRSE